MYTLIIATILTCSPQVENLWSHHFEMPMEQVFNQLPKKPCIRHTETGDYICQYNKGCVRDRAWHM